MVVSVLVWAIPHEEVLVRILKPLWVAFPLCLKGLFWLASKLFTRILRLKANLMLEFVSLQTLV
jgi:hypothetical protein